MSNIQDDLTPEQRAQLGDLAGLQAQMQAHHVPEPDRKALLETLKPLVRKRQAAFTLPEPTYQADPRYWWRLTRLQTALMPRAFVWVGALLLLLGLPLVLLLDGAIAVPAMILGAPILSAAGISLIFYPATRTLRQLERISPVHPAQLLYSRLAFIMLFYSVLTLAFLLNGIGMQGILWRLLLLWFGPMLGVSGLALYSSIRWNALIGALLPVAVWCGLLMVGWWDVLRSETRIVPEITLLLTDSVWLLNGAGGLLLVGLLLWWQSGRLLGNV